MAREGSASVRQQKMLFVSNAQIFGPGIGLGMTMPGAAPVTLVAIHNRVPRAHTAPMVARAKTVVKRAYRHAKLGNTRRAVAIQSTTMVVVHRTHSASIVQ